MGHGTRVHTFCNDRSVYQLLFNEEKKLSGSICLSAISGEKECTDYQRPDQSAQLMHITHGVLGLYVTPMGSSIGPLYSDSHKNP